MSQDYRDLKVWKKAVELAIFIYKLTLLFPTSECYGLTAQMRRTSGSAASNIAEGRGRLGAAEFRQFLGLAQGSTYELQTQLIIAKSLGLGKPDAHIQAEALSNEVSKMLTSFINRLTVGISRKS